MGVAVAASVMQGMSHFHGRQPWRKAVPNPVACVNNQAIEVSRLMVRRALCSLGLGFVATIPALSQGTTSGLPPVDRQARAFGPPTAPGYTATLDASGTYVPGASLRMGSAQLGNVGT